MAPSPASWSAAFPLPAALSRGVPTAVVLGVTPRQDPALRVSVLHIAGPIPAASFVQVPKAPSQSLGLRGRYAYLILRTAPVRVGAGLPLPLLTTAGGRAGGQGHPFVVHFDVLTDDGPVRLSYSSLYKGFKAAGMWLQFPAPAAGFPQWTLLRFHLPAMAATHAALRFVALRGLQVCADVRLRAAFTSDLVFRGPDLPREFSLFVPRACPRVGMGYHTRAHTPGTHAPVDGEMQTGASGPTCTRAWRSPARPRVTRTTAPAASPPGPTPAPSVTSTDRSTRPTPLPMPLPMPTCPPGWPPPH